MNLKHLFIFLALAVAGIAQQGVTDLVVARTVKYQGSVNASLTGNVNDWAPTDFSRVTVLRVSATSAWEITGLAGGAGGRWLCLVNVDASSIVLKNQSSSSIAANRFALGADLTITTDASVYLYYDGVSARWRVLGGSGSGGGGGGGGGGVTSVGLSLPAIFSVSGSPVTSAGTLTATLATQAANTVFSGPTAGGAATPTFRALVLADIPSLTSLYEVPLTFNTPLSRATNAVSIADAAANGSTKGAAAFATNDFDAASGVISLDYTNGQKASSSIPGFLLAADWTTFNNKQPAGNYITALTGDGTASGPGSATFTLANTAVTPGSYTNANITVDSKGRVIAAANGSGGGGADADAIHDNVAGEISAITDKATPVAADHLLIEDSAESDAKKDITIGSMESALEGVMDLQDMQGTVTDAQVPNTITVDLATAATNSVVVDSTDSTSFPLMVDSATGNLQPKTDAGVGYNASNGQWLLGSGSVTAPPYTFSGDTDSGAYSVSANVVGIATGGSNFTRFSDSSYVGKFAVADATGSFYSDTGYEGTIGYTRRSSQFFIRFATFGTAFSVGDTVYMRARGTPTAATVVTTGDTIHSTWYAAHVGSTSTHIQVGETFFKVGGTISDTSTGASGVYGIRTRVAGGAVTDRFGIDENGNTNITGNLAASGTITATGDVTGANLSGTNTGNQSIFQTISVSGQSDVVADTTTDTATLVAGTDISITTNSGTDSITINNTKNVFTKIAVSGQSDVDADATGDTLTLAAGTNVTLTTNAGTDTVTIAASGGGGAEKWSGAFDGQGVLLTVGSIAYRRVYTTGNITKASVVGNASGSITLTVKKYTPSGGALGSATTLGTFGLASTQEDSDSGLTWAVTAGDVISVETTATITTVTRVNWDLSQ